MLVRRSAEHQSLNRHPNKVLSIFEPHTEAIRKGKLLKPTEFGKMVAIQEADGGIVTDYQVEQARVADTELWRPAIDQHIEAFGHAPHLATADRGFYSAVNEKTAGQLGVERVCLPGAGKLSGKRRTHQRQRWFRAGLRWRTGSEGTDQRAEAAWDEALSLPRRGWHAPLCGARRDRE